MKVSLRHMLRYLGPWSIPSPSRVFVSVSVVNAMPPSRLSRHSSKVIVKVSIWTCLILILLFLVVYTILLVCVDKQMHPAQFDLPYKKIRLLSRISVKNKFAKSHIENGLDSGKAAEHRTVIWNSSLYFHETEPLPLCKEQTFITVLVTSSPEHSDRRMVIRNSWCKPKHFAAPGGTWKCIFLVGNSDSGDVNSHVKAEKALHNDIILGSYTDSYRNLTLKVILGFNWSTNYCPSSYVVKTDDDCYVNAGLLHNFLTDYNNIKHSLYAGSVVIDRAKLKVIRGSEKKWSVRYEDYSKEYYPPYASGIGYVLSADVVQQLVSESAYIYPIPNEDAYIGIVMSHIGISPVSSSRFVLSSSGLSVCNFLYVFIVHHVQIDVQLELLNKSIASRTECNHSAITTWS